VQHSSCRKQERKSAQSRVRTVLENTMDPSLPEIARVPDSHCSDALYQGTTFRSAVQGSHEGFSQASAPSMFAPPAPACRGAYVGRNDGRSPSNDLLCQTAGRSPKKLPPKENPEGYGLQPVHKCIHRGPALAAEGRIFPSIQRHHEKNTSHT